MSDEVFHAAMRWLSVGFLSAALLFVVTATVTFLIKVIRGDL